MWGFYQVKHMLDNVNGTMDLAHELDVSYQGTIDQVRYRVMLKLGEGFLAANNYFDLMRGCPSTCDSFSPCGNLKSSTTRIIHGRQALDAWRTGQPFAAVCSCDAPPPVLYEEVGM
jgi:hypothetical protein